MAFVVPDCEFAELCWEDGELVVSQGHDSKVHSQGSNKSQNQVLLTTPDSGNTLLSPGGGQTQLQGLRDGMLEAVVHNVGGGGGVYAQEEDDLLSWLQIPREDALEKCFSEPLGEIPSGAVVHLFHNNEFLQGIDECPRHESSYSTSKLGAFGSGVSTEGSRRGRLVGPLVKQNLVIDDLGSLGNCTIELNNPQHGGIGTSRARPTKPHDMTKEATRPGRDLPRNFSHFSRPSRTLSSATTIEPIRQMALGEVGRREAHLEFHWGKWEERPSEREMEASRSKVNGGAVCSMKTGSTKNSSAKTRVLEITEPTLEERPCGSNTKETTVVSSKRKASGVVEDSGYQSDGSLQDPNEDTGGIKKPSKQSAATKETIVVSSKRKASGVVEDSGYQSDDPNEDMGGIKKPLKQSAAAKKSRAAEVHIQSERLKCLSTTKDICEAQESVNHCLEVNDLIPLGTIVEQRRRDRINEKLKALQELVPNSSKTDKASLLDDAIQHMKMLQAQLQMMCAQSGMAMPPMFLSPPTMATLTPLYPPLGFGPSVGVDMARPPSSSSSSSSMRQGSPLQPLVGSLFPPPVTMPSLQGSVPPQAFLPFLQFSGHTNKRL